MYILSNAMKNLLRNKGRNMLLMSIILAIVITTVVTLSITRTAEGIIDDYRARFGSQVNITIDTEAIMESFMGGGFGGMGGGRMGGGMAGMAQITAQQHLTFAQSAYLLGYDMTAQQGAGNVDLLAIGDDPDNPNDMSSMFGGGMMGGMLGGMMGGEGGLGGGMENMVGPDGDDMVVPNFRIIGNSWGEFETGERILVDGHMPLVDGEAIISVELAELNGLSIGDEITFYSSMLVGEEHNARTVSRNLTITGIYLDLTENMLAGFFTSPFTERGNEVLTTLNTVIDLLEQDESGVTISATYFLSDPSYLPNFEAELRANGLPDTFIVTTDEATYNAIVQPVVGLRSVAMTFMIVVLILGGLVLILLSFMAIRERKYEIGVLRAMGMKKRKLVLGLWAEMFAITAICLVIGLSIGTIAAQPISDSLLAAQVESINNEAANASGSQTGFGGMGGLGGMGGGRMGMFGGLGGLGQAGDAAPLDNMDLSMGIGTIMEIIGISLLLTSLAALLAITRITKYEPIKILMERT